MKTIGVIGGHLASASHLKMAEQIGSEIARLGMVLVSGGLSGVMEAACRGAKKAGGKTLGILPGIDKEEANKYVDIPVVTGLGLARNILVVRNSDLIVAIDGRYGTLSEISYALHFQIPVIGLETWDIEGVIKAKDIPDCLNKMKKILAGLKQE